MGKEGEREGESGGRGEVGEVIGNGVEFEG